MAAAQGAATAATGVQVVPVDPKLLLPAAKFAALAGSLGADFNRRNNLHAISTGPDGDVIVYAAGNAVRVHSK
jgi:hypothetical protein